MAQAVDDAQRKSYKEFRRWAHQLLWNANVNVNVDVRLPGSYAHIVAFAHTLPNQIFCNALFLAWLPFGFGFETNIKYLLTPRQRAQILDILYLKIERGTKIPFNMGFS